VDYIRLAYDKAQERDTLNTVIGFLKRTGISLAERLLAVQEGLWSTESHHRLFSAISLGSKPDYYYYYYYYYIIVIIIIIIIWLYSTMLGLGSFFPVS
jgi:hypothetical protein